MLLTFLISCGQAMRPVLVHFEQHVTVVFIGSVIKIFCIDLLVPSQHKNVA